MQEILQNKQNFENPFFNELSNKPGLLWSQNPTSNLYELFQGLGKSNLKELHARIDDVLYHMVEKDNAEWLQTEWRIVSSILDRLFLYTFLGTLSIIVFGCCIRILYIP